MGLYCSELCICSISGIQSRMTTDWINQSPGLYRAKRERELHHHYRWMVQHGRQIERLHKVVQHGRRVRDCIWWCNQEGHTMGCGITKKVVSRWSYKEGKELTYRQASQLLEIPDAVKTCLHSLQHIQSNTIHYEINHASFINIDTNLPDTLTVRPVCLKE